MSDAFAQAHAVVIGVGADLPNTVDDATGLANILQDPARCAYPPQQVCLLTGEQATRDAILTALTTLAQATDDQSTVTVYFSGHGYRVTSPTGEFHYLLPYGYNLDRLYQTAISGAEFAEHLQAIPAQKLLVLLDCCHAGGVGDAKAPGLEMAKAPLPPEAQALLAEGSGRVLVASSQADELSYAGKPYSAFTLALIEALCGTGVAKKDGYVRVADLAMHARQVVPGRTKDRQHPVLHFEQADNFVLAFYAGGESEPKGLPFTQEPQIEPQPGAWTVSIEGTVDGPVAVGSGDAVDLRGAQVGDGVVIGDGTAQVTKITVGDIQNVAGDVVIAAGDIHLAPKVEIPPPPEPVSPPEIPGFVGRESELAALTAKLSAEHMAVLVGMPGVGKTALAATLARQTHDPTLTFWHTFHEGEGIETVIWKLAAFLATLGQQELWQMLQSSQQTGGQPPPPAVLLDYLFQMLRGQGILLCLDDVSRIDDDPLLEPFVTRLQPALQAGDLTLIVTSQQTPSFVPMDAFEPLQGLTLGDTLDLLAQHGLSAAEPSETDVLSTQTLMDMPDLTSGEIVTNLHARTEGNPLLLNLAADAIKHAKVPARFLINLFADDDIERFLIKEIDDALTEKEQSVMSGVAVLLGYPGTRDAIEEVLDGQNVRRTLSDLSARHLLDETDSEIGPAYSMNTVMRHYYYDLLGKRERKAMHLRAGEYYESEEPDPLRAARHMERAQEIERAVRLATADIWSLINQGQARPLRRLLEEFTADQMEPPLWAAVNIARGQVYTLLGRNQVAKTSYQEAWVRLDTITDIAERHRLGTRACQGLGHLLQYESPKDALNWLQRGLDELTEAAPQDRAALHIQLGAVQIGLGDFEIALQALGQGLELLPPGPSQLRADALMNLGSIYGAQGNMEQMREVTQQGLEISQQLHDQFRTLGLLCNLGLGKIFTRDWPGAVADLSQALTLAQQRGSVLQLAGIEKNLGALHTRMGEFKPAQERLTHALRLAREHTLKEIVIHALTGLAALYIRQEEWETATGHLDEAEKLAHEMDTRYLLPEIYTGQAQVHLAQENSEKGLVLAGQAVELAHEMGLDGEEGQGQRVMAQALLARDKPEEANKTFEQSLTLLQDSDPYEAARTQVALARALLSQGNSAEASPLLQDARTTFQTLTAQHDLMAVEQLLEEEDL